MKFAENLIHDFMKIHFENSKTKINQESIKLVAEVMRLIVEEGAVRACNQAKLEGSDTVTIEHLERFLRSCCWIYEGWKVKITRLLWITIKYMYYTYVNKMQVKIVKLLGSDMDVNGI